MIGDQKRWYPAMMERAANGNCIAPLSDYPLNAVLNNAIWTSPNLGLAVLAPTNGFECVFPALQDHLAVCVLRGRGQFYKRSEIGSERADFSPGTVSFRPAGFGGTYFGDAPERLLLRLSASSIQNAWSTTRAENSEPALMPVLCRRDVFIERLSAILIDELDRLSHPSQALFLDSAAVMLATHLVASYGTRQPASPPQIHALAPDAVRRVSEYMEENLGSRVRLDELSVIAGVSRFHFLRSFKAATGVSPMASLERRRILRAQSLIRSGGRTMAQIASTVGFADQGHFSRRFRLHVGMTPTAYERDVRCTSR